MNRQRFGCEWLIKGGLHWVDDVVQFIHRIFIRGLNSGWQLGTFLLILIKINFEFNELSDKIPFF